MNSRTWFWVLAVAFAAQQATAFDWRDPQSLATAAAADSPTIARLQSELTAAQERITYSSSQPNPMLMGGVQDKQIDLTDDEMMTMYMVGASQRFVRPSKRDVTREAGALAVKSIEQQIASARAEVERETLFAYYDLAAIDSRITAIEKVREMIDAVIGAARYRYESGLAVQADVLRAQLTRSDVDRQLIQLRGARAGAASRLLAILGAEQSVEIPRLALARTTEQQEIQGSLAPPENHPALAALAAEVARQELAIRLARLESKPDFSLEAIYGFRPEQKDMFSVVGSIELPLRRKTLIEPRIREAIALRDAAKLRIAEARRTLARDLATAAAAHEAANQQLRFLDEVLVPQSKFAFDSTLASYQSGKSSFDAVVGAETTYLRLELDYYGYLADHIKAITDFEAIQRGARAGALSGPMSPVTTTAAPSSSPSAMSQM